MALIHRYVDATALTTITVHADTPLTVGPAVGELISDSFSSATMQVTSSDPDAAGGNGTITGHVTGIFYKDGATLTTPSPTMQPNSIRCDSQDVNPTGLTWALALQGFNGLQAAVDEGASSEVHIWCRNNFDVTVDVNQLLIDTGGAKATNEWLRIIGCPTGTTAEPPNDGDYLGVTAIGSYTEVDGQTDSWGVPLVLIDDVDNVALYHIHVKDNGNDSGFEINNGATRFNYLYYNCKSTGHGERGWNFATSNARGHVLMYCVSEGCTGYAVYDDGLLGGRYYYCNFKSNENSIVRCRNDGVFYKCAISGSTYGIFTTSPYLIDIIECVFYNQDGSCYRTNVENASAVLTNNIFMPAEEADKSILHVSGSIIINEYNVLANVATGAGCSDIDAPGENNIVVDPQFADAANGDYRIKATSEIWNKGMPGMPEIGGGLTTPGAWQRINRMKI